MARTKEGPPCFPDNHNDLGYIVINVGMLYSHGYFIGSPRQLWR